MPLASRMLLAGWDSQRCRLLSAPTLVPPAAPPLDAVALVPQSVAQREAVLPLMQHEDLLVVLMVSATALATTSTHLLLRQQQKKDLALNLKLVLMLMMLLCLTKLVFI